jgi:hypothetical protein
VAQDDQHVPVEIDAAVFQPDVALQTLLDELIAPVSIDPPILMQDNLNNAAVPVVKSSIFYGSSKRRCDSGIVPYPVTPKDMPQSTRTVRRSRKPARLNN